MINLLEKLARLIVFVICLVVLQGCGPGGDLDGTSPLLANGRNDVNRSDTAYTRFQDALSASSADRRRVGTGIFMDERRGEPRDMVQASGDGAFTLNLVDVPIEQAAQAVLGEALGRTYTIDPEVSGTVTLQTSRPMSERDLLDTFQTILELNGATISVAGEAVTIVPLAGSAQRIGTARDAGGIGNRVVAVPLEFVGTAEMVRLIEPIAGSTIRLQSIPNRNILLIAGARDEINAVIEAISLFDVDVLKGKSVGLFKLRAAEPEAVVAELTAIFEASEGASLQNVINFVPSTRLGAIIVITTNANYLADAERWIKDLDKAAGGSRRRPVVYSLQNRSAADLAPVLSEMIQQVAAEESATVEGAARVVADDARNAIIVWGNDSEQDAFARLIQSLDTTPVQVLLEATIAEVKLTDELKFGLRWFFENGDLGGTFPAVGEGSRLNTSAGLSFLFQGASAAVALNALNSVTDVNVVSSPSLLVLDNQEARLQIGDQVPVATQQTSDTSNPDAPIVNTITFRDTGIILTVKPRVSSSGQVVLDIEQEVSKVSNTTTSGIDSPTISQRRIKTSVVVTDGQTIALGGLIEEGRDQGTSKVPVAGDVPVLGVLFRDRKETVSRTELLVLITPRVIRNGHESQAVTEELRRRIQEANGIVQNGIVDPGVGHRIVD
jgi:general secretion pathway protein D